MQIQCQKAFAIPWVQQGMAGSAGAGEQAMGPLAASTRLGQGLGSSWSVELSYPQKTTDSTAIHRQGEGGFQPQAERRQTVQGEFVGEGIARMAPMTDLLKTPTLARA
jgi:hypothetical protein